MISEYTFSPKKLFFVLGSLLVLSSAFAESLESNSNKHSSVLQDAFDGSREKRNAEIDLASDDNLRTSKRYIPYEELQKRLRHFIGKRNDQDMNKDGPEEEKRMRYFVGKRADDGGKDDLVKRMRYFLGKRSDSEEDGIDKSEKMDPEKRMRYFVGKRRYFLGKRRYFLGKRRYFLGKRDDLQGNDDSLDKRASRLRYFVGKRPSEDFINGNAFHKRMRYFVGKRNQNDDDVTDTMDKRMRYFVGKRQDDEENIENQEQPDKRGMRYFLG